MKSALRRYLIFLTLAKIFAINSPVWADPTQQLPLEDEQNDLLDLVNGALTLSQSSEYGEEWISLMLLDGGTKYGWCSKTNAPFPHQITFELAHIFSLEELVIDNTGVQESEYPGISARLIEVWVSTEGPESGYVKAMEIEAAQGTRKSFPFPQSVQARWIKLAVESNYGDKNYTEIMEVGAYGDVVEKIENTPFSGVYDTNYNLIKFKQVGNQVTGCYDWDGGMLTGTSNGRSVLFEWRQKEGKYIGTAVMVTSADGSYINGIWYEDDGRFGYYWRGPKVLDGRRPKCETNENTMVTDAIVQSGRFISYGILFDFNSDQLKQESDTTLKQVLGALKQSPALNLVVEGHSDSAGNTSYNMELSQRRATAVVNWLKGKGIQAERLKAEGLGERQPIADNDTQQGRALNRRVEFKRI